MLARARERQGEFASPARRFAGHPSADSTRAKELARRVVVVSVQASAVSESRVCVCVCVCDDAPCPPRAGTRWCGAVSEGYFVVHVGDVNALLRVALVADVHHQVIHGLDARVAAELIGQVCE